MKMCNVFLLLFLSFSHFRGCISIFDIDELKSFNYGIDIRKEPVLLSEVKTAEESNKVMLSSKYGQAYQCDFPNTIEQEKEKEEAEKEAIETGIPDLLKPMDQGPCLRKTKDWWSYEFCYGKQVRQYHLSEDNQIQGEIISLGHYESEYNWDDNNEQGPGDYRSSKLRRYHTQQYVNGSKCDLTGKGRRTEVRFLCEEGSADYISRVDEPESCSYVMTVHTMKICHHPFLKPPTSTQTITITCNPVLTPVQYEEYQELARIEKQNRKIKAERILEEKKKLLAEKLKYLEEKQEHTEEEGEVEVEGEETEEGIEVGTNDQKTFDSMFKATKDALQIMGVKTTLKVANSPDELKQLLDEAMAEFKKEAEGLKEEESEKEVEEEEEKEDVDSNKEKPSTLVMPEIPKDIPPSFEELKKLNVEELDPELEEVDEEIKTIKERYKNKRDRLNAMKAHVKETMEKQYASIVKETEEELGVENNGEGGDNKEAMRTLTQTLDKLLHKLDQTEKDIEAVDRELEQFAEYDSEEKTVKSVPPVKESVDPAARTDSVKMEGRDPAGPTKTPSSDRVKVRVKRLQKTSGGGPDNEIENKQTTELERSVQKELEKAGLGDGDKIQVKIITTGYYDSNDDTLHVLSDEESETFKNMILNLIGAPSEADKEQNHHSKMEESYNFVWGQDKASLFSDLDIVTDSSQVKESKASEAGALTGAQSDRGIDTQTDTHTDSSTGMRANSENGAVEAIEEEKRSATQNAQGGQAAGQEIKMEDEDS